MVRVQNSILKITDIPGKILYPLRTMYKYIMTKTLNPVPCPITQDELRNEIRAAVEATSADYSGITADPFGDVSTQASHRNEMHVNSPVWPAETLWGEKTGNQYQVSQCYERCKTLGDVIAVSADIVETVLNENPSVKDSPAASHWVADKVAEGYAFRMGVIEGIVEEELAAQVGLTVEKRTLTQVAKDESNDIDIRTENDVFQVKFDNNSSVEDNVRRVDVVKDGDMLQITVE